jgi:hypothetical protein
LTAIQLICGSFKLGWSVGRVCLKCLEYTVTGIAGINTSNDVGVFHAEEQFLRQKSILRSEDDMLAIRTVGESIKDIHNHTATAADTHLGCWA